jgi:hypothetical protein
MSIATYEGVVEKGKIRFAAGVKLPENAKVYVIVTDTSIDVKISEKKAVQILSPRLKRRSQAARFKLTVTEERPNAKI